MLDEYKRLVAGLRIEDVELVVGWRIAPIEKRLFEQYFRWDSAIVFLPGPVSPAGRQPSVRNARQLQRIRFIPVQHDFNVACAIGGLHYEAAR